MTLPLGGFSEYGIAQKGSSTGVGFLEDVQKKANSVNFMIILK